ncbi:MAG TPA: sigma-70 family RNA polymerase sigma factor [Acidimicrobiales bacterium]|nr:sigma-70 family RNA polymerase sigma factor [Acidimicrobiales bacterium]
MMRAVKAEARFRALFVEAYPALQRYARHRGLTGADADDLVAEVLTIAWRRLDHVPLDDPLPWLFVVARNVWRNGLRSGRRRLALLQRLAPPPAAAPPPEPPGRVRAALETLGDDDQELLRLVAWDDLTPTQIAAVLGCSPGAARVRIHRARTRLAAALGEVTEPPEATESRRPILFEEETDVPHR